MRPRTLLCAFLVFTFALTAFADDKNRAAKPSVLSGKSIAFITFATGTEAEKLKTQASDFFVKWKKYEIDSDPQKADLLVLLGPMPRHVSGDAFDAVLAGKPSPEAVDTSGAQAEFAVFDGAEVHGSSPVTGTLKPVWSTEMNGDDVKSAAKKYKQLVDNTQESYDHMGLTFDKCRMVGLRCSH